MTFRWGPHGARYPGGSCKGLAGPHDPPIVLTFASGCTSPGTQSQRTRSYKAARLM